MAGLIILAGLLLVAPLVVAVTVAVQLGVLKASVDALRRRVADLERGTRQPAEPSPQKSVTPPAVPTREVQPSKPPPLPLPTPAAASPPHPFNWESFLGVKLFAWIGGLALFLGVVFFVKYAFENSLITPLMRIVAGGLIGSAALIAGALPMLRRFRIPAQSLCAAGILILYGDVYAAYSFYHLIPLSAATVLMWMVTGVTFLLGARLDAPSAAWLALIGGFLTPLLLNSSRTSPAALFGYVGVFDCAVAILSARKRWNYLLFAAAMGSVILEFNWAAGVFGPAPAYAARIIFLTLEAEFIAIFIFGRAANANAKWSIGAAALTGLATLVFCIFGEDLTRAEHWSLIFWMLFLGNAGLITLASAGRKRFDNSESLGLIPAIALALTALAELANSQIVFNSHQPGLAIAWYVALFVLFAAMPCYCGSERFWPWLVGAIAGPVQFWFVYQVVRVSVPTVWIGLLPIAFALPAAAGLAYLTLVKGVALASADSRLASQGAAVLAFVSLVFPVQFEREWITLGWAVEGLAIILLFRMIPNRRLRGVALILFCASFIRLALNPAVLEYHPRTEIPILNWYFYAYGLTSLCLFGAARWFGFPREKPYERNAAPLLYTLCGLVFFLLLNIEIADYFSIGPTLTFSFEGNFARDMTYTIGWAMFALALLVMGVVRNTRPVRLAAVALLCLALGKLFFHDLDTLNQLYRIAAFLVVAVIAIVSSFVYQRFLSPGLKHD